VHARERGGGARKARLGVRAGARLRGEARKFLAGVREQLIAYARHARALARPRKDGSTLREHLERVAQMGGPHGARVAAQLAGPEFPEACAHVWTWFCALHGARSFGPNGPNPIGYAEIAAWARLTRRAPQAWEVDLLRELDGVWLTAKDDDAEGSA